MFFLLVASLPLAVQGVLHRAVPTKLSPGPVLPRVPALASQRRGTALLAERSSRRAERRAARQARQDSGAAPPPAVPAPGVQPSALPPGWTAEVDPASGSTYYADAATGASQWERPGGPPPPPAAPPAAPDLGLPGPADFLDPTAVAVRDAPAVDLPTFDDFRSRERQAMEESAAPETTTAKLGAVQERLLELLTFDTIDDRPQSEDPYDWTARLIGRGLPTNTGVYPLPYLQSGHIMMLITLLLSTTVTYPGFPLTEVPEEYRAILLQGLGLTYGTNALAAFYARGIAEAKQEPAAFWMAKTFLLGGLALDELAKAVPEPLPEYKQRQQAQRRNS